MNVSGFVLAGGRSTRMGRDKALLPWGGQTLLEHVAGVVRAACGNVTVLGPERGLGLQHLDDDVADCGPLGGLLTAMHHAQGTRVLLVACDMPAVTRELLRGLMDTDGMAVVCDTGRLHPLCGVYHRRLLGTVERAVYGGQLRMHDFLASVHAVAYRVEDASLLANVNTPGEYAPTLEKTHESRK